MTTDRFEAFIRGQDKDLLRFITCGSVDDGKSTLIGRLLYESKLIYDDQLEALEADSKRVGTQGEEMDLALLVDGLSAEREQGITIDVAYRFFSTSKRKFIVADTPGHEQYTRNTATGASTARLAVLLIDARKGVLVQTLRHSLIVSMLGVKHVVLAINKMDLVDYSQEAYQGIIDQYGESLERFGFESVQYIPVSALKGDNIVSSSSAMPWYEGPALLDYLEVVQVDDDLTSGAFRMPVQWVNRPDSEFRGFSGQISSGSIRPGDAVRILPSGRRSAARRIVTYDGDLGVAVAGQSVTLVLEDEVDVSRGDVIAAGDAPCPTADQFQVQLLWMSERPMLPGRSYLLRIGTQEAIATIARPRYKLDINTNKRLSAQTLELNEVAVCNISLDRRIPFEAYKDHRQLGGFVLIDTLDYSTMGLGLINFALRRTSNIHWQDMDINQEARALIKEQRPVVIWFTGLSGSGKSTIADLLEQRLYARGKHTILLDGDNVRHGLNRDLGFTAADRVENIRRIAHVSELMLQAGLIVLTAFISPFTKERRMARERVGEGEFIEIFVDTPLEVAEARDPKGLYKKARAGHLKNFTGIDSPYERPSAPEIHLDTTRVDAKEAADQIIAYLEAHGYLSRAS